MKAKSRSGVSAWRKCTRISWPRLDGISAPLVKRFQLADRDILSLWSKEHREQRLRDAQQGIAQGKVNEYARVEDGRGRCGHSRSGMSTHV